MTAEQMATITVLGDFDEPALTPEVWDRVLAGGSTDVPFLTLDWQREWWRAFGGDRLLLVVAERAGSAHAIAPLFALDEMLFLVGSGGSDYLDFVGVLDEELLAAMLDAARSRLPEFAGLSLFHIPVESNTTALLEGVAERLDLELFREGGMSAPYLDLSDAERVAETLENRKLRKAESRMRRAGALSVHAAGVEDLDPWLDMFFAQHEQRWSPAGEEGLERADARAFCRAIVHAGHRAGWLRFTMLKWQDAPAAFDISLVRGGRYVTYLVSRDTSITTHSPGKILERHVIRAALEEGARCFDFGLGDEEYKLHHASGVAEVANWSLYP